MLEATADRRNPANALRGMQLIKGRPKVVAGQGNLSDPRPDTECGRRAGDTFLAGDQINGTSGTLNNNALKSSRPCFDTTI